MDNLISEAEFQAYEDVRKSGVTNMMAVKLVSELSGLQQDTIFQIMEDYNNLCRLYPNVRTLPNG
jgi:hypothetical protein